MNKPNLIIRLHRRLLPNNETIGWVPYLWLVYLLGFLIPVYAQRSTGELVYSLLLCAAFLVLYFRAYWVSGRQLWPYIAAIALIGALGLPIHGTAMTFFIFAGSFAGYADRPRTAFTLIAILMAVQTALLLALDLHWIYLLVGNIFTPLIGAVNIYYAELERKNKALQLSRVETEQMARFAERERIGRDLHDLLGHTLSVIALKADLAAKLIPKDPDQAKQHIEEVRHISRTTLQEVREAVRGFREQGLAGELANARTALEAMDVHFHHDPIPTNLPTAVEAALAMILREAITNTVRHAQANNFNIAFQQDADNLTVVIREDGIGGPDKEGQGIRGMRDRIQALNGTLTINRQNGRRITLTIPNPPAPEAGG